MKKIILSGELSTRQIIERYKVSRVTAWRAKNRGWLILNYHERSFDTSFSYDADELMEGKEYAERLLFSYALSKETKEDCISEAILRCLQIYNRVENVRAFIARTAVWNAKHIIKYKERTSTSLEDWEAGK